jgi:zinc-ribbon domain
VTCPQCGHETVVEVRFCPSCGHEMAKPAQEAPAAEQPAAEAPPEPEPAQPPAQAPGIVTIPLPSPEQVAPAAQPVYTPPVAAPPPAAPTAPPPQAPVVPTVVAAGPPQPTAVPPAAPPPMPPAGQPAPIPPTPVPGQAAAPPPKKGGKGWLWACGCGCLLLIAAGIALVLWGSKAGKAVVQKAMDEAKVQVEKAANTVTTDSFEVVIPDGWDRETDKETGSTRLFLRGPEVNGTRLVMGIDVYDVGDMSLEKFSDEAMKRYKDRKWTEDKAGPEVTLCGEPARRIAFVDSDGDNLFYLAVSGGKGYLVTMISPEGTMGEQEAAFDEVLKSFDLHQSSSGTSTSETGEQPGT